MSPHRTGSPSNSGTPKPQRCRPTHGSACCSAPSPSPPSATSRSRRCPGRTRSPTGGPRTPLPRPSSLTNDTQSPAGSPRCCRPTETSPSSATPPSRSPAARKGRVLSTSSWYSSRGPSASLGRTCRSSRGRAGRSGAGSRRGSSATAREVGALGASRSWPRNQRTRSTTLSLRTAPRGHPPLTSPPSRPRRAPPSSAQEGPPPPPRARRSSRASRKVPLRCCRPSRPLGSTPIEWALTSATPLRTPSAVPRPASPAPLQVASLALPASPSDSSGKFPAQLAFFLAFPRENSEGGGNRWKGEGEGCHDDRRGEL